MFWRPNNPKHSLTNLSDILFQTLSIGYKMSDIEQARLYLENSILAPLLSREDITDITFNGESLFYQSSIDGRKKAIESMSYKEAYQLIKQLANFMNLPFTYLDPIVEMSIIRYRIFAVGPTISRKHFQPSITFAIRIHPLPAQNFFRFLHEQSRWKSLFQFLILHRLSFVIAGKTGSGKTQLQKELLGLIPEAQRVIVLDNILELDGINIPHLDLTIWQIPKMQDFQRMITGALRSHPDWLLIAESRGEEFKEVLRSVKTGHPIITTLHSDHIDHIYSRMISMLLIGESISHHAHLLTEVKQAFPILIQLESLMHETGVERKIKEVQIHHRGQIFRLDDAMNEKVFMHLIQSW